MLTEIRGHGGEAEVSSRGQESRCFNHNCASCVPLGKALQLALVCHRASHVLHDTRHKGCHLFNILQRQNSFVAILRDRNLLRIDDTKLVRLDTGASKCFRKLVNNSDAGRLLVGHFGQAPHREGRAEEVHAGNLLHAQTKHAKLHLGSPLVIANLVLKETDSSQARAFCDGQDFLQVLANWNVRCMILTDKDRSRCKQCLIVIEEKWFHVGRGVVSVEAVREP
mmetsp:Transcript_69422/g.165441  ORF Transcript_69422/g.165441 Transcript_69422/m.165441 type:complete len:224 (-) Transcript_69422:823-1494(-)